LTAVTFDAKTLSIRVTTVTSTPVLFYEPLFPPMYLYFIVVHQPVPQRFEQLLLTSKRFHPADQLLSSATGFAAAT